MPQSRLIVLSAGNFFVAVSFFSVSGLLNEIAAAMGVSVARAGLLIAAFALTASICAPVLATAGSRIDRRKLLTGSLAICAVANILCAVSQTYSQLMAARILAAITSAVYTPQVAATVSMLVEERERGPSIAKLMMGWAIGSVVGGPLVVLIGTSLGWRVALGLIGVASGITAALVWRALPDNVKVPPLNWQRWLQVLGSKPLMLLTATTGLNSIGNMTVFSYLAPITKALHGISGQMLAGLYFINGLGGLIGNIFSVRLIEKRGAGRVAFVCGVMIAVTFFLWPLMAFALIGVFVLQIVWSLAMGGFPSSQQTRLVMVNPAFASATIAMNSSVGYLGTSIGSMLGASAWNLVGPRYLPWIGLSFVLASIACSVMGERAAAREQLAD
ncbi:MAG TPA: MFS transporter [Steroidobacteraceae bacterium]|nr:MFS transporter [Steroidobacteraceae bacterium]